MCSTAVEGSAFSGSVFVAFAVPEVPGRLLCCAPRACLHQIASPPFFHHDILNVIYASYVNGIDNKCLFDVGHGAACVTQCPELTHRGLSNLAALLPNHNHASRVAPTLTDEDAVTTR